MGKILLLFLHFILACTSIGVAAGLNESHASVLLAYTANGAATGLAISCVIHVFYRLAHAN